MNNKSKQKLQITFHNPNSSEVTIKFLTSLLAETAVSRVTQIIEEYDVDNRKKAI